MSAEDRQKAEAHELLLRLLRNGDERGFAAFLSGFRPDVFIAAAKAWEHQLKQRRRRR